MQRVEVLFFPLRQHTVRLTVPPLRSRLKGGTMVNGDFPEPSLLRLRIFIIADGCRFGSSQLKVVSS